jgi:hypothetical protein
VKGYSERKFIQASSWINLRVLSFTSEKTSRILLEQDGLEQDGLEQDR